MIHHEFFTGIDEPDTVQQQVSVQVVEGVTNHVRIAVERKARIFVFLCEMQGVDISIIDKQIEIEYRKFFGEIHYTVETGFEVRIIHIHLSFKSRSIVLSIHTDFLIIVAVQIDFGYITAYCSLQTSVLEFCSFCSDFESRFPQGFGTEQISKLKTACTNCSVVFQVFHFILKLQQNIGIERSGIGGDIPVGYQVAEEA